MFSFNSSLRPFAYGNNLGCRLPLEYFSLGKWGERGWDKLGNKTWRQHVSGNTIPHLPYIRRFYSDSATAVFEYRQPRLVVEALWTWLDMVVTVHASSLVVVGIECGGRKHPTDVTDDQAGDERQEIYEIVKRPHTTNNYIQTLVVSFFCRLLNAYFYLLQNLNISLNSGHYNQNVRNINVMSFSRHSFDQDPVIRCNYFSRILYYISQSENQRNWFSLTTHSNHI